MHYLRKEKSIEVSSLADFKEIAYEHAKNFRDKYGLGNYPAKQLVDILDALEQSERIEIKLIRTPIRDLNIAGFIGYKHETFVIVTNTNLTLGNERFTIAHEIYHLLQNRVYIKENRIIEEMVDRDNSNVIELMANSFAAELLMPGNDIKTYADRMTSNKSRPFDSAIVIKLQQKYGVDYAAITNRLREIGYINESEQMELEKLRHMEGELEKITKSLGYTNELNTQSKDTYLLQKDLEVLKDNYDKGYTSYDDMVRIFGYLGCEPEKFGYENEVELSNEAKEFMKGLLD